MAVDVTATGTVNRPRDEVAAFLRDPANDPAWIGGIRGVRLLTPGPVAVGSQVERTASFLGRRVHYVNEITDLTPTSWPCARRAPRSRCASPTTITTPARQRPRSQ